jgi:hypothetical protein
VIKNIVAVSQVLHLGVTAVLATLPILRAEDTHLAKASVELINEVHQQSVGVALAKVLLTALTLGFLTVVKGGGGRALDRGKHLIYHRRSIFKLLCAEGNVVSTLSAVGSPMVEGFSRVLGDAVRMDVLTIGTRNLHHKGSLAVLVEARVEGCDDNLGHLYLYI